MRASQRTIWLFSIGLSLCTASYAERKATPSIAEKAGREWAEQWLGDLRKRFAKPHEPVMHRANRGVRSFRPRMELPFLNTPPITGRLTRRSTSCCVVNSLNWQPKLVMPLSDRSTNTEGKIASIRMVIEPR